MPSRRTDLALEAHDLRRAAEKLSGAVLRESFAYGCRVTTVTVETAGAARALKKPRGEYVTLDLAPYWQRGEDAFPNAVRLLAQELRRLIAACGAAGDALVVGLGNAAMTPDAVGPAAAEHILVTRHLKGAEAFSGFAAVSVLTPGVLGKTGMETAELVRGAVRATHPSLVIAVDSLASARLERVCNTVQLSDTGIVPGSGVGNHRSALNRRTLGIPVIAIGVPTVVDAASLALDILEEAGAPSLDAAALRGHDVMVTPRDIDAQIAELGRIIGYGIDLALQPQLDLDALTDLMG